MVLGFPRPAHRERGSKGERDSALSVAEERPVQHAPWLAAMELAGAPRSRVLHFTRKMDEERAGEVESSPRRRMEAEMARFGRSVCGESRRHFGSSFAAAAARSERERRRMESGIGRGRGSARARLERGEEQGRKCGSGGRRWFRLPRNRERERERLRAEGDDRRARPVSG